MLVPTTSVDGEKGRRGEEPLRKKRRRGKPTLISYHCRSNMESMAFLFCRKSGIKLRILVRINNGTVANGTVSYRGVVARRLAQDVFELDGPGGLKLLLSNSGESCANGGVAIVPGVEIVACNVHVIYSSHGVVESLGTCSLSQIQISKFSKQPYHGQILRRAKSHAKGLYRHFGLNLRESLWINNVLQCIERDFFRSSCSVFLDAFIPDQKATKGQ